MSSDLSKCPWCGCESIGSPRNGHALWTCGSAKQGPEPYQSDACRVYELEAKLAAAEAVIIDMGRLAHLEASVARAAPCPGYKRGSREFYLRHGIMNRVALCIQAGKVEQRARAERDAAEARNEAAVALADAANALRYAEEAVSDHMHECDVCDSVEAGCAAGTVLYAASDDAWDAFKVALAAYRAATEKEGGQV